LQTSVSQSGFGTLRVQRCAGNKPQIQPTIKQWGIAMKNLTKSWIAVSFTAAFLSFGATAPALSQNSGLVVVNLQDVM
jgi:hypothetical protein